MKEIMSVQRCKGWRDWEFYEVFSLYCGHPIVL